MSLYFLIAGAGLTYPLCVSACELKMKDVIYWSVIPKARYAIQMKFHKVCAPSIIHKRELEKVELSIFDGTKRVTQLKFKAGSWIESKKLFRLSGFKDENPECRSRLEGLRLDLSKGVIKSLKGLYLNLISGQSLHFSCLSSEQL